MISLLFSFFVALFVIMAMIDLAQPIGILIGLIVTGTVAWGLVAAFPVPAGLALGAGAIALLVRLIIRLVRHRRAILAALRPVIVTDWRTLAAIYTKARQTTPETVFCAWACVATLGLGTITFLWKSLL
jgi:hypothetical protein